MTYPAEKTRQAGIRKINLPIYVMLALTVIGISDAMYVAYGSYRGTQLWCPILDGCNTVVNSPYSRVLGMPMSYFGFIYYLFTLDSPTSRICNIGKAGSFLPPMG
jgi:uncharacterized membrane protein